MNAVKKCITLPKDLDKYVMGRAKRAAKAKGNTKPNFSASLSEIVLEARKLEKSGGGNLRPAVPSEGWCDGDCCGSVGKVI